MPSKQSQLGSLALQSPSSTSQTVHVSPSTCYDLSLFKDILRQYRRVDDTIGMRLNRANAVMRDQQRTLADGGNGNVQDQACTYLWRELVENWKRRTQLVDYCVSVVDQSLQDKQASLEDSSDDAASRRKTQAAIFEDQVKRKQVHNELTVEDIIRKRTMSAFRSRCQYFIPPMTDVEARKMWEAAQR